MTYSAVLALGVCFAISLAALTSAETATATTLHVRRVKRQATAGCENIFTKAQWAGKPGKSVAYQTIPIHYVIVHHTTTQECASHLDCSRLLRNMQSYHQNQADYDDIAYNFLIGSDGVIYEGTGWGVRGSHTYGYNMNGTGIAFIGNFNEKAPSQAALDAGKRLLACGVQTGELDRRYRLYGALQVSATESPGLVLYQEIQKWRNWQSKIL